MARPMNTQAARIVDPVLTNVARGYRSEPHAWPFLFPVVTVGQRGGKVVEFGTEEFVELAIARAPGANREQLNFGHSSQSYTLDQRALDGKVPREILQEASAVPGIDYGRAAVAKTMEVVSLQIEIKAAQLATAAESYDADHTAALAGAEQWSDAASTPAQRVEAAKETIASGIGRDPNILVLGPAVYRALVNHPDVIDRIKHTEGLSGSASPMVTTAKLAGYFDVAQVAVARARTGQPGDFSPIWGKNAVLAYANVTALASLGSPSYGYTYRLEGYPIVEPAWFDKTCDSWLYPVTTEDTPVIAGQAAGYLFTNVVA